MTLLATKDDQNNRHRRHRRLDLGPVGEAAPVHDRELPRRRPTAATPGYPSQVHDVSGALGRGGYEGIQNDSDGNIWIVEDIGGSSGKPVNSPDATAACTKRFPNSFVYRYVPAKPGDLANGKLQVLQVLQRRSGSPITEASRRRALNSRRTRSPCTPTGNVFDTNWVTIHDTAVDGTAPFNANALAKRRTARRSSGRRTASSSPARSSASSSSTRPATRTRPAPRTTAAAAGARSSS